MYCGYDNVMKVLWNFRHNIITYMNESKNPRCIVFVDPRIWDSLVESIVQTMAETLGSTV